VSEVTGLLYGPLNGHEDQADPGSPLAALSLFYRGFNQRDIDTVAQSWAPADDIVMDNPLGGVKRGWPEIEAVYRRIFQGPTRVFVEFHDVTLRRGADMFWAAGRERGELRSDDTRLPLAIRTSRIFQLVDGRWRQVHHHGSIDDPQQLAAYQEAVSGRR
jgi:ketosteroid isomerase-like protein